MLLAMILLLLLYPFLCNSQPPNSSLLLNTTRIFPLYPLDSTISTNISRDAPYISYFLPPSGSKLSKPFWVFSDTETFDAQGNQTGFVSNSAGWDRSDRQAIVDAVRQGRDPNLSLKIQDILVTPEGAMAKQWIPYTNEELAFNRANKRGASKDLVKRLALWPNCPPTAMNQTHAFLYCTIIEVSSVLPPLTSVLKDTGTSSLRWLYTFKGISLVSIVKELSDAQEDEELSDPSITRPSEVPSTWRMVPTLFTDKDVAWGNFGALIGQCPLEGGISQDTQNQTCIYPIAIGARGLMLASVPLNKMAEKKSYTFFDTRLTSFRAASPTHSSYTAPFLNGTFSSGNIFFSEIYQTFLIVYFNRLVDNSFYIRFLDRQKPLHSSSGLVSQKDTKWTVNKDLKADEVEAVVHYTWSPQYKLYETTQGKGGFSYAGSMSVEYFSGVDKNKSTDEASWILLTWTEQTGMKVEYKTRGAVVGFLKNVLTDTSIISNASGTIMDEEEEVDMLNETRRYFPWDDIYTRQDTENETLTSGTRQWNPSVLHMNILLSIMIYVSAVIVWVPLFC